MDAWTAAFLVSVVAPPSLAIFTYPVVERRNAEPWRTVSWTRDTAYRSARAETVDAKPPGVVRIAALGCWVAGSLVVPWVLTGVWAVSQFVGALSSNVGGSGGRAAWLGRNIATLFYVAPILFAVLVCMALSVLHARACMALVRRNLARTFGLRVVANGTLVLNVILFLFLVVWSVLSPSSSSAGTLGNVFISFAVPGLFVIHALTLRRAAAIVAASGVTGTPRAPAE